MNQINKTTAKATAFGNSLTTAILIGTLLAMHLAPTATASVRGYHTCVVSAHGFTIHPVYLSDDDEYPIIYVSCANADLANQIVQDYHATVASIIADADKAIRKAKVNGYTRGALIIGATVIGIGASGFTGPLFGTAAGKVAVASAGAISGVAYFTINEIGDIGLDMRNAINDAKRIRDEGLRRLQST